MHIRVGVIGCGNMGRNHIRTLNNLSNLYKLVGVFDSDAKSAQEMSGIYDVPTFESAEKLIELSDALIIASPSPTHAYYGHQAISKKKDILIEKPIALVSSEAKSLLKQAAEQEVILMVGQIELFNPVIKELKSILNHEDIISLDCHRLSPFDPRVAGVDVVRDLMIHDICNVQYFLGNDIASLQSCGLKVYSDQVDYAQAIAKFTSGVQASLTVSRITEGKTRTLCINARDSYITADFVGRSIEISRKTKYRLDVGHNFDYIQENIIEKVQVQIKEPLSAELEHFAHCISSREQPVSSGKVGLDALVLCEKILDMIK